MKSDYTDILYIQFANEISQKEIPFLRGAVIHSLEEKRLLFHNHEGDKFRYAYPLIQYKRIMGKAAVVFIGKGVELFQEFMTSGNFAYRIGNRVVKMLVEAVDLIQLSVNNQTCLYRLHDWLPFNSKNYELFLGMDDMVSKVKFLERILIGNILSFFKGIGVFLDQTIVLTITNIIAQHTLVHKGMKLMAFDLEFKADVALPQYIGLGKNVSVGFGVLTTTKNI